MNNAKKYRKNSRMEKTGDLFKKIRDTKGTFHTRMGTVKNRNGKDLTEQKRLRRDENTQELYKKCLNDLDNHR